jgi:hypothetical protein
MSNQTVEFQAKVYIYDLNNCANEHGFKADEAWELSLATDIQKAELEKKYYPTISTKALPEVLAELIKVVKGKLTQVRSDFDNHRVISNTAHSELQYLIAFNPNRHR